MSWPRERDHAPVRNGDDVFATVLRADRPQFIEVTFVFKHRKIELVDDVLRLQANRDLTVIRTIDVHWFDEQKRLHTVRELDRAFDNESVDPLGKRIDIGELGKIASHQVGEPILRKRIAHRLVHHVSHVDRLVAFEQLGRRGGQPRFIVGIHLESGDEIARLAQIAAQLQGNGLLEGSQHVVRIVSAGVLHFSINE